MNLGLWREIIPHLDTPIVHCFDHNGKIIAQALLKPAAKPIYLEAPYRDSQRKLIKSGAKLYVTVNRYGRVRFRHSRKRKLTKKQWRDFNKDFDEKLQGLI